MQTHDTHAMIRGLELHVCLYDAITTSRTDLCDLTQRPSHTDGRWRSVAASRARFYAAAHAAHAGDRA